MSKTKRIIITGLLMSLQIVLGAFVRIPVGENLNIYFTYIIVMITAIILKPTEVLIYAVVEDNLAFFLFPNGTYFPGYTLTAVAGIMIYSAFLNKEVSIRRIILAKTAVNVFVNIALNSVWSAILFSKGYLYYLTASTFKNLIMLPLEILIFIAVYRLVQNSLYANKLINEKQLLTKKPVIWPVYYYG